MPVALPIRAADSSPDEGPVPTWCGDGDYAAYFHALADRVPAGGADAALEGLHRLLVHVPAAISALERVALYRALWRAAARLDASALKAAGREFDGAFDRCIGLLAEPLNDQTALQLARAHLDGDAPFPVDAAFVRAWLLDQGLGEADADEAWLAATRAWVADVPWGCAAAQAETRQALQRCEEVAQRAPALAATARRLAVDLALALGDDDAALQALTRCVDSGAHAALAFGVLQRWLEGGSLWPLALSGELQPAWLRPDLLHTPRYRAQLAGALRRPALRMRIAALRERLGDAPDAAVLAPAHGSVLYAVGVLDDVHARAEQGQPITDAAAALLRGKVLARQARAMLQRRCALEAADRIDPHAAALALADARRATGEPQDAHLLRQLLLAIDAPAVQCAAAVAGLPLEGDWLGGDPQREEALWAALAAQPHPHLQALARYQLAMLCTEGHLAPTGGPKRHDLQRAHDAWNALRAHPAYAAAAEARLANGPWRLMRAAESREGGRQHLWVPAQQPGPAQQLLIVFACVESHHRYAQLGGLAGLMPGHDLLFVNNPELNWYSDQAFDEVVRLIEQRVLPRFVRQNVTCYFGSMGGHAALKFALHFGFQAIAFNPQIDLRLWAAFRPQQRALLLAARAHAQVQDAPLTQFEQSPACYFCGSAVADREAFRAWLQRVQAVRHGSFIIEKSDDAEHAGLIGRLVPAGQIPALLHRTQARLRELAAQGHAPAMHAEVPAPLVASFWQRLAQATCLKLEVLVRDGRVFVADSLATGTAPPAAP